MNGVVDKWMDRGTEGWRDWDWDWDWDWDAQEWMDG